LAAVENYLQTILGGFAGELNPKQERMLNRCVIRVTDLSGLISDVVDLARMRPEQIQADFEWFDPGEVGRESIEDARLAATEKNIQLRIQPPPEFTPIVGSRRRMRQVFTNLLNNAIKFSPPDTIVHFKAWYEEDQLIFTVEDNGPGVPPEDIPYIFTDFFRASNVGDSPGAGLGLSIAKKIMDAHEGDILIENMTDEDGAVHGSKFTVLIPLNLNTPEMRRREWIPDDEIIED
jgi:signal transduction histidine kinase